MNPAIPVVATLVGLGATKKPRRKRTNKSEDNAEVKRSAQRRRAVLEVQTRSRLGGVAAAGAAAKSSPGKGATRKGASEEATAKAPKKTFAAAFVGRRGTKPKSDDGRPEGTLLGKILNARHGPSSRGTSPTLGVAQAAQAARAARAAQAAQAARSAGVASEAAEKLPGPGSLFHRRIGGDIILSEDGQQGFVGARWWAETGRSIFDQLVSSGPVESPEDMAVSILRASRSDIDWGAEEAPEGIVAVRRRVSHYVQGSLMSQEPAQGPSASAPPSPHQFGGAMMGEAFSAVEEADRTVMEARDVHPESVVQTKRKRRGSRGRKKEAEASDGSHDQDGGDVGEDAAASDAAPSGE